jgi:thiol:disulfide interchange protein DsbD
MTHPNRCIAPVADSARARPSRRRPRDWRDLFAALVVLLCVAVPARAEFLEPTQAFRFSAQVADANTIAVTYDIADGYYLYRERFKFALDPATAAGAALGEPQFPKGEIKYDETFAKDVEHYRGKVVVRIPVIGATGAVTLLSTSQGCADAGLCYPPQVAKATLKVGGAGPSSQARDASSNAASAGPALDDASRIARTLRSGNIAWIALLFVGLGVLLAFTPCVLPMVPILSSILVGQANAGERTTRFSGFVLALAYSLGMALVYTMLGIAAGLAGEGLAAALQAPWILATFAALLVVLSLSMFGVYTLQLPAGLQARMTTWSGRMGGSEGRTSIGRLAGVFAMGAVSALIVGPCVAAPLAGTLVYISQTRDVVLGGLALFSLAIGMSVPLLLVGLSAGTLLPRVGAWMESVKRFFGVLLIAVALWMVMPIVPTWIAMLAWAILAIMAAVHLRVFDALAVDASGAARLAKGVGVVLLLAGTVEFVGLATGGRDVLQPLAHLARETRQEPSGVASGSGPSFEPVRNVAELDRRLAAASAAGKPVLLDFYADWCVSCKEMERFTYGDARVASRMQDFVLLKADVTANGDDDRALLKRFQLFGPPGIIFYDRSGRHLAESEVIGFQDADRFLASLSVVVPDRGS